MRTDQVWACFSQCKKQLSFTIRVSLCTTVLVFLYYLSPEIKGI